MWLTSFMAKNIKEQGSACVGKVSDSLGNSVGIEGSSQHRTVPVVMPYGVFALPPSGVSGVTAETDSGQVFLGVVALPQSGLQPGEIMLCSKGGASIVLKNSGEVIINGKVWE